MSVHDANLDYESGWSAAIRDVRKLIDFAAKCANAGQLRILVSLRAGIDEMERVHRSRIATPAAGKGEGR
jgi:hypothetical protein